MAITLVIDYGTGAKKTFTGIAHQPDMNVVDVMNAAATMAPGVEFAVEVAEFVSRAGLANASFRAIDGVENRQSGGWQLLIDGEPNEWLEQTTGLNPASRRPQVPDSATMTVARSG